MKQYASAIILTLCSNGVAASEPPTIESNMSARDFQQAGLNKLTVAELELLNAWLNANGQKLQVLAVPSVPAAAVPNPAAAPSPPRSGAAIRAEQQENERQALDVEIVEVRTLSSGKLLFKLSNGELWRQTGDSRKRVRTTPVAARLEPGAIGSWRLKVDGINRGFRVRFVQ